MILHIDTTEKELVRFELYRQDELVARIEKQTDQMSEEILTLLDKFLKKNKVELADLKKIEVNPGPGSFSAVRTGVAAANALAFALGLKQKVILPKYDKDPNITSPTSPQSSPISERKKR